ncbi:hypothetical protein [Salinicola salarius]|uniref:hypothetical protein n=1 Tax=Salinicola salarius TaxID=430457 RepID=UPI0023E35EA9|nr:hypothetical protein [Salinicola salarius]
MPVNPAFRVGIKLENKMIRLDSNEDRAWFGKCLPLRSNAMSRETDNAEGSAKERQQAKKAMDKDTPDGAESRQAAGSHHEEPKPYRPDANVDNQKSAKSRHTPAHNDTVKETPVPGAQLAKEKKAHKANINEKADKADPKASG